MSRKQFGKLLGHDQPPPSLRRGDSPVSLAHAPLASCLHGPAGGSAGPGCPVALTLGGPVRAPSRDPDTEAEWSSPRMVLSPGSLSDSSLVMHIPGLARWPCAAGFPWPVPGNESRCYSGAQSAATPAFTSQHTLQSSGWPAAAGRQLLVCHEGCSQHPLLEINAPLLPLPAWTCVD